MKDFKGKNWWNLSKLSMFVLLFLSCLLDLLRFPGNNKRSMFLMICPDSLFLGFSYCFLSFSQFVDFLTLLGQYQGICNHINLPRTVACCEKNLGNVVGPRMS